MVSYHSGLTDQCRLLQLTPRDIRRMENRRASNRRAADKCRKKKKALEALKQEVGRSWLGLEPIEISMLSGVYSHSSQGCRCMLATRLNNY